MSQQEKIKEALRRLLDNGPMVRTGTVTAVDAGKWTCTVKCADGLELKNVFLKLYSETEKGVVIMPKVNTDVRILNIGEPYWMVIAVEQADKIYADADTEIVFNGGDNGGLVIVKNLVDRLNKVEKALSDLINKYNAHTHITTATIGSTTTPGVIAPTTSTSTEVVVQTQKSDIENTKIKH